MNFPELKELPTQEEVDELKAQVEYFKNGMAELQDYIDKNEPVVNELSATVQLQRTALDSVLNRCDISNIPKSERLWLFSLTDPEPAQCLAEVRAQAYRDGYSSGWQDCSYGNGYRQNEQSMVYAKSIRQQSQENKNG